MGTLVERTRGYLILVKMLNATATSAVEGFSAALNSLPLDVRKSMTYAQSREMAKHNELTQKTDVAIYFCDPMNIRPRKRFGFKFPIEVLTEGMGVHHEAPA